MTTAPRTGRLLAVVTAGALVATMGSAVGSPAEALPAAATGRTVAHINPPTQPGQTVAVPGWRLRSSAKLPAGTDGAKVSSPDFAGDQSWYPVGGESTVMAGLIANGVHRNITYSDNMAKINKADFAVPWWYRHSFTAKRPTGGDHVFLRLPAGIIARGELWLNGKLLAGADQLVGAWPRREFDVTSLLRDGANAIAVKAVYGDARRTELTISFLDWNQRDPSEGMGLWRGAQLVRSGSVSLRDPNVLTKLDVPNLKSAELTVKADLQNNTKAPVTTTVRGRIGSISFQRNVTLAAGAKTRVAFTPADTPALRVQNPRVWWPYQFGKQPMYALSMTASVGGEVSDKGDTTFGIRDVKSHVNADGGRQFVINGKPILIRGGGFASDLFLREQPERLVKEFQHVRNLGLNTVRLEGKDDFDSLHDVADRMGILLMPGWECCSKWEDYKNWTPADKKVAADSAITESIRLRNHPSMLGFYVGSDVAPPAEVEQAYVDAFRSTDWPVPLIPSAKRRSSPILGDSGNKMDGPYWWIPPSYWYTKKVGGAFGFASEVGSGAQIPEMDSLKGMLSPADQQQMWTKPQDQLYHLAPGGPFKKLDTFSTALEKRYGKPTSLEDFVAKAQLENYDNNRAQFESYGRNQSDAKNPSTGVIYWMMNDAWPSLYWHLYEYDLSASGGYFGAQKALRPLHIQYGYDDRAVSLVNTGLKPTAGLSAQVTVFAPDGTQKSDQRLPNLTAGANGAKRVGTAAAPAGLTGTYFVRLLLRNAAGQVVDRNVYWLSTKPDVVDYSYEGDDSYWHTPTTSYGDLTALRKLPKGKLDVRAVSTPGANKGRTTKVTLTNTSAKAMSFFARVNLRRGATLVSPGTEVTPVRWDDNYVTLWPGEKVTLTGTYAAVDLHGSRPWIQVSGQNIRTIRVPA